MLVHETHCRLIPFIAWHEQCGLQVPWPSFQLLAWTGGPGFSACRPLAPELRRVVATSAYPRGFAHKNMATFCNVAEIKFASGTLEHLGV